MVHFIGGQIYDKQDIMRTILIIWAFSAYSHLLFSQKLTARPHIGLMNAYNNIITSPDGTKNFFETNIFDVEANYGVSMEYRFSNRSAISIGITTCLAGYSYRMTFFKGECNPYVVTTHFSAESSPEFTLGYHHTSKAFGLIRKYLKRNSQSVPKVKTFPLKAKVIISGGFGLSHLAKTNEELNIIQDHFSYTCPDLSHKADIFPDSITLKQKTNFHLWGKVGLQFFHNDKERFELAITFNQGILNHYTTDVKYQVIENQQTTNYSGVLGSKGTSIALTLSYPITIWKK